MKRTPSRPAAFALLLTLGLLPLAGCGTQSRATPGAGGDSRVWTGTDNEAPSGWIYPTAAAVPDGWKVRELLKQVTFPVGGTTLSSEARGALGEAIEELQKNTSWHVLVVGHADAHSEASNGDRLAERRARAVVDHLRGRGLAPERIHQQSLGTTFSGAEAHESIAQRQDRRAEAWAVSR